MIVYTKEVAMSILNYFEDMLDEKDIDIPDDDRTGDPDEARLYGMTFDDLLTKTEQTIIELSEQTKTNYVADTWNMGAWYKD